MGSLSFGSTVSASSVSKPIFEINDTKDKTNISTPMLSGSGNNVVSFVPLSASTSPKSSGGRFAAYSSTIGSGVFKFGSSKGGSEFETFYEIKTEHVGGE